MRVVLIALIAMTLASCAAFERGWKRGEAVAAQNAAIAAQAAYDSMQARCEASGVEPGTPRFSNCMVQVQQADAAAQQQANFQRGCASAVAMSRYAGAVGDLARTTASYCQQHGYYVPPETFQAGVSGVPQTTGTTCFSDGEEASGMNKICYYSCLGSRVAFNVQSVQLCPLTIQR